MSEQRIKVKIIAQAQYQQPVLPPPNQRPWFRCQVHWDRPYQPALSPLPAKRPAPNSECGRQHQPKPPNAQTQQSTPNAQTQQSTPNAQTQQSGSSGAIQHRPTNGQIQDEGTA